MHTEHPEYFQRFTLSAGPVDFTGHWHPSAVLDTMQTLATTHAELIGVGRALLLARNRIWILSRTHLQMYEYPMMYDEVIARTWPGAPNRFFFPRHFTFARPDGTLLGAASTLWLLLDLEARAVVPPGKSELVFPDTAHLAPPLPPPDRVATVAGQTTEHLRTAAYTDLDVNRHVNNTRYADWVCDALPLALMRTHCVENLLLNYTKEILPEQAVRGTLSLDGERFSMLGESQDGAQTFFEIGGTLMPRRCERRI